MLLCSKNFFCLKTQGNIFLLYLLITLDEHVVIYPFNNKRIILHFIIFNLY